MYVGYDLKLSNVPASFSLPNVTILHLCLGLPQTDFAEKLIFSCPGLEDLYIKGEPRDDTDVIFVFSSSVLKRLYIHLRLHYYQDTEHKFLINAPSLEYLNVERRSLTHYPAKNLPSVLEARILTFGVLIRKMMKRNLPSVYPCFYKESVPLSLFPWAAIRKFNVFR